MKNNRGFTLIELSIVLVIIGLIVGGVLVGRDLIDAAKIRKQMTSIEQLRTAANTFENKYGCFPGDCRAAGTRFGLFTAYRPDSDDGYFTENGFIDGPSNNPDFVYMFAHLRQTGLWNGCPACDGSQFGTLDPGNPAYFPYFFPASIVGTGFIDVAGGAMPCCGTPAQLPQNYIYINNNTNPTLTAAQSFAMDSKTDDGNPLTGQVIAVAVWDSYNWVGVYYPLAHDQTPSSGVAGSANCVSTSSTPNSYNTQNTSPQCAMRFNGFGS